MDRDTHLKEISKETLDVFDFVASEASKKLNASPTDSSNSLASVNTMTGGSAVDNVARANKDSRASYQQLTKEPAIARIVVEDDDGNQSEYYVCRATPLTVGRVKLASYNSAVGRIAELSVGDEYQLRIDGENKEVAIVEKMNYKPVKLAGSWDSTPGIFDHIDLGVLTIESLKALLRAPAGASAEDALEALLAGGAADTNISEGIAHQAREAMSLRDQPILDKFQGEIFRLPINSQLIILGPPGTGKTTTLIKRLGQKLDTANLESNEKQYAIDDPNGRDHQQSWLMFTPTELLKHYVKEAFARENVVASDDLIKAWDTERSYIARNVLSILESSTSKGRFIHKPKDVYLKKEIEEEPEPWFDQLFGFHKEQMVGQLRSGLELLEKAADEGDFDLLEKIKKVISGLEPSSLLQVYRSLDALAENIRPRSSQIKSDTDARIRKCLVLEFNKDRQFLSKLAVFIDELETSEEEDDAEQFDDESGEEEEAAALTNAQQAEKTYIQAIRSLARNKYLGRAVSKASRAAKIREWLGDRFPADDELEEIGRGIALRNGYSRYLSAENRYVKQAPQSFSKYRKDSIRNELYYSQSPKLNKHVSTVELDAVLLLMLKAARELLQQSFVSRNIDDSQYSWLAVIKSQFRTQVLVDEVTDFSSLQIGSMACLTKVEAPSFFACGDFNQRITTEGVRSLSQVQWAVDGVNDKSITTVYRQSEKLNEFSKALLKTMGGDMDAAGQLPKNYNHQGFPPALVEGLDEMEAIAQWLFSRIKEVLKVSEKPGHKRPTIAVLVNGENEVKPFAEVLDGYLEDISIKASACVEGKVLGEGDDVRVFDIQHIKGLEFEAVFFVNIDQLAQSLPRLFDKYLYVGATRAATYLGVTCSSELPDSLEGLREKLTDTWST